MRRAVVSHGSHDGDRFTQRSFPTDRYGVHHNRWTGVRCSQRSKGRRASPSVTVEIAAPMASTNAFGTLSKRLRGHG
jgi:hypothetical protein